MKNKQYKINDEYNHYRGKYRAIVSFVVSVGGANDRASPHC